MIYHSEIAAGMMYRLLRAGKIRFGGNRNGKIYGTLSCRSGKRMRVENRVFFSSVYEAVVDGYRPCAHCMRKDYERWKYMKLLDNVADQERNLLPRDGIVNYYGKALDVLSANKLFTQLMDQVAWQHDQAVIYGKLITTRRKVAWYGNDDYSYTYSNTTRYAKKWIPALQSLKELVEQRTGESFNSCLLNLYHSGEEGMAWHSDAEKELKKNGAIASLSLGAERKFSFKHKQTGEKIDILLEHGSLLVMKGQTQSHWLHSLPKTKKITEPRINLTFRMIARST